MPSEFANFRELRDELPGMTRADLLGEVAIFGVYENIREEQKRLPRLKVDLDVLNDQVGNDEMLGGQIRELEERLQQDFGPDGKEVLCLGKDCPDSLLICAWDEQGRLARQKVIGRPGTDGDLGVGMTVDLFYLPLDEPGEGMENEAVILEIRRSPIALLEKLIEGKLVENLRWRDALGSITFERNLNYPEGIFSVVKQYMVEDRAEGRMKDYWCVDSLHGCPWVSRTINGMWINEHGPEREGFILETRGGSKSKSSLTRMRKKEDGQDWIQHKIIKVASDRKKDLNGQNLLNILDRKDSAEQPDDGMWVELVVTREPGEDNIYPLGIVGLSFRGKEVVDWKVEINPDVFNIKGPKMMVLARIEGGYNLVIPFFPAEDASGFVVRSYGFRARKMRG